MERIILIRGPLGVGKSTVAKAVAEKLGASYVSIDGVLEELKLDTADENGIPLENFLAANAHVIEKLKSETTTVIDGNFYHKEQVDDFVAHFGDAVRIVTLKAPVEVCVERDSMRERSYGEDAARAVHAMVSSFDVGTVIETDGKNMEEVVKEVLLSLDV